MHAATMAVKLCTTQLVRQVPVVHIVNTLQLAACAAKVLILQRFICQDTCVSPAQLKADVWNF